MSLALIAAFVVVPTLLTQRKPAIERSVSGIEIILLKPQGTISTSALDFEWTPLPEIQNYHLEIYDQSLEPVYISSPLSSTRISLSNEVKGLIQKDRQYFWKVVAAPKGERSMIESEFGKFRLQK
jgi:hypothetical protein